MTKDQALKMALGSMSGRYCNLHKEAIAAIEEVLAQSEHSCVACEGNPKGNNNPCAVCGMAQPEQEPVAWFEHNPDLDAWFLAYSKNQNPGIKSRPLVFGDTAPPQRKPLSDEEITGNRMCQGLERIER